MVCGYLKFLKLAVDLKLMDTLPCKGEHYTSADLELKQWVSKFEKRRRKQLKARDRLKSTHDRDWLVPSTSAKTAETIGRKEKNE